MRKKTVLLLDDELYILKACQRALSRAGYAVAACSKGSDGLALIRQNIYDLVVTDLKMPGVDGIEILKEVKRLHKNTSVIIMTGYPELAARETKELGTCGFITKPFDINELKQHVSRCIESSR